MSQETETPLQKALMTIDNMRKRILLGGWLAVIVTLFAYGRFYYELRHNDNVAGVIDASVMALTCLIAWATFAVILTVVRMTRKILVAVDLSMKANSNGP
jgi:hypothetical protein